MIPSTKFQLMLKNPKRWLEPYWQSIFHAQYPYLMTMGIYPFHDGIQVPLRLPLSCVIHLIRNKDRN